MKMSLLNLKSILGSFFERGKKCGVRRQARAAGHNGDTVAFGLQTDTLALDLYETSYIILRKSFVTLKDLKNLNLERPEPAGLTTAYLDGRFQRKCTRLSQRSPKADW